ncbi:glycosyltransferase family 4 protein [Maribacter sp. 2307UL18-2]|uniref:glycosyltransferase family 4 protein n=1 Tax=Maribacter sp. 2307UL18-2 TaxID=3386274 RepID=UPI0039BCC2DA
MKVDFLIGCLGKGGAERVMAALSGHFVHRGHSVRVITFDGTEDSYELDGAIERVRLTDNSFPIIKIRKTLNLIRFYKDQKTRPDIAISFLTATNLSAILGCRFRKIPIIVSEHNNHLFVPNPRWLTRFSWRYIYRLANFVTVLTAFDVPFFEKRKANVVVMPNPCSFATIDNNEHKREKIIVAIGNLNRIHHKGFDNLITIVEPLLKKNQDWKLQIIGGGERGRPLLEEMVREKALVDKVDFLGFQKNINSLMRKASIFILSSRYEGLPMVLLECMSQGMACVSYDCVTGPSEMISNEVNGLLVEDQNIHEMQNALERLFNSEELRKSLGDKAIQSIARYEINEIYEKWGDLLSAIDKK